MEALLQRLSDGILPDDRREALAQLRDLLTASREARSPTTVVTYAQHHPRKCGRRRQAALQHTSGRAWYERPRRRVWRSAMLACRRCAPCCGTSAATWTWSVARWSAWCWQCSPRLPKTAACVPRPRPAGPAGPQRWSLPTSMGGPRSARADDRHPGPSTPSCLCVCRVRWRWCSACCKAAPAATSTWPTTPCSS